MIDILILIITFYGGLIALGYLTKWYIAVILFFILYGHATHLDSMFLRKKDLYHAMMRAWEDIFTKTMPSELDNTEHGISMPGEEESLH
jgi:hypothetical protein